VSVKLLLVIDRLSNPHAGTESQLLLLASQLRDGGNDVHLLVLAPSDWLAQNSLPCPVTLLGSSSIKDPRNWCKLRRLARQWKRNGFDLAHVFFNDASVLCPPIFRSVGIRTIISRRDMGYWYNAMYRGVLPITGRFVDRVITNSEAVAGVTQAVEKIPAGKISVIYNGHHRPSSKDFKVEELESLQQSDAIIVGIVANIRPIKRIPDAIAAVAKLRARHPRLHLVIIGDGDDATLRQQAEQLDIADRLHFLGSRSDVPDCLRYFTAGLLCSESEGFSNAIVEYQFAGLPVVCTDAGGNPEAVTPGVTGYLYPVGDVEALAVALEQLLSDPDGAKSMGREAQRQAEQRYSVSAMVDRHLALYRLLSESRQ
jgi:glycosyltransferase involved in cell wall biosynthesis